MANRRQPLIPGWLWPGAIAATLIVAVATLAFASLWFYSPATPFSQLWHDRYVWHVVRFTVWQAFLSALISLIPALFIAGAFYRRRFPGRTLLLRLSAMTLVLPVLVAVFGLLTVYGRQGWLAQLAAQLGIGYPFSPYGLSGILLAHAFFNVPLATRLFLHALENIAVEQRQLAAQLGMSAWQRFRLVEWPALQRHLLPIGALIFMLCFASFATVLTLGGGPSATTIELAIYQALYYDFDPPRAAMLGLIQLSCCLLIVLISQRFTPMLPAGITHAPRWRAREPARAGKILDSVLIALLMFLLLPPLLAVIVDGLSGAISRVIYHVAVWQALLTSLHIAVSSGLLCLLLTMMLLWSSRELKQRRNRWGARLEACGTLILAMPAMVLATGFFLFFLNQTGLPSHAYGIVIFTNALMAMPYALNVLESPMRDLTERYSSLSQSLGLVGWRRLYWVELNALKRPLSQALAFACVLSIGDFGVIALFGNTQFFTLPYYLYQQLGNYRSNDAAVTALVLLLTCFLLFTLIERILNRHDRTD